MRGDYVFCRVADAGGFPVDEVVMVFKEKEAVTLIVEEGMGGS